MTYATTLAAGVTLVPPLAASDPVVYYVPVSLLFDETIPDDADVIVLLPSLVLAAGTLRMPTNPQKLLVNIGTAFTITLLTHQPGPGQAIINALTTLAVTGGRYVWRDANNTWYKVA